MKYSVIIPVYNGEKYIKECVDSILNQNRDDTEIIVVNDGSKDNTLQIVESIKANNLRIINKNNTGSMDSWIRGVEEAVGEYICFIDSDDIISDKYFDILDGYVDKYDIVIFDFYRLYQNGCVPAKVNSIKYGQIPACDLSEIKTNYYGNYEKYSFYRWDKVVKSSILKSNIKKIKCRAIYFEDLIIGILNLLEANEIYYLDEKLYFYRMRKSSVSHGFNQKIFEDNLKVESVSHEILTCAGYSDSALEKMHVYFLFHYARWAMRSEQKPIRQKVSFTDICSIDGINQKAVLILYKFRLSRLFNLINAVRSKRVKKDKEFFE